MTEKKKAKKPSQKTPLALVKEKYGDKKALAAELSSRLDRKEGESKADLEKRLLKVSCKKLLTLVKRADEVEKLGGRANLIDQLHDHSQKALASKKAAKENPNLKKSLTKKTTGALLDKVRTIQKKSKKKS